MAACFEAVHTLLHAFGVWDRLITQAPFRAWAEQAKGGEVADVAKAIEAERERRAARPPVRAAAAAGMAR